MLKSGSRSRGEMKMLHLLVLTLLTLTGVLSDGGWGVNYSEPICAVRGSNAIISCTYFYPKSPYPVEKVLWCSMNSNSEKCQDRPYVYNSDSPAASRDFKYVGDKTSNCTLLISNVQFSHSGEYKFRFITDVKDGRWTGDPGVTLKVAVVQVSMIRLSGNGTLKEGDSVNLTCAVNCSLSSPQFVWFKNTEHLPESGSVLHLPALTVRNSGNYSCALRNYENFTSEMISLDVEGHFPVLDIVWIVLGVILFMLLVAILAVVYKRRKKAKAPEEDIRGSDRETQVGERTQGKQTKLQDNHVNEAAEAELQEDEITYASVCTKPKKPKEREVNAREEEENSRSGWKTQDEDVMYASVSIQPTKPKKGPVHTVQEDDSIIYSAVKTN
ncbi:hypothetical protein SRHO_G00281550 [Serrasalmus rhombeus]